MKPKAARGFAAQGAPLPPRQAADLRERLRGLSPTQAEMMRQVMRLHAAGDRLLATQWLLQLAREAPSHPEVCLWQGARHHDEGSWAAAVPWLEKAVQARPAEFTPQAMLGTALARLGEAERARGHLQRAAGLARDAAQWFKLSIECDALGEYGLALQAVEGHLRLEPRSAPGLLQRARVAKALGDSGRAAADARTLIAAGRERARAWFTLLDLKVVELEAPELALLQRTADDPALSEPDRILLGFALGKALEDAGEHAGALAALERANAAVRRGTPWDAVAFARQMQALRETFPAAPRAPVAAPADLGSEVIFLVGLPRSGSTLAEQVLAAHPRVEGASELPFLHQVLQAESARRGRAFPDWAPAASADDWTRLGREYLQLTATWRSRRPVATDKLPDNWQWVGAIRAMLPGARIIDCRRELLETSWSCFKQLFGPGLAAYSYDFESLAAYAATCELEGVRWAAAAPDRFRIQHYEALVAEPETQIRELLAFCGLPFDAACLRFQDADRAIRTPSALQVRQPMQRVSRPAAAYGALLDPLRAALASARTAAGR